MSLNAVDSAANSTVALARQTMIERTRGESLHALSQPVQRPQDAAIEPHPQPCAHDAQPPATATRCGSAPPGGFARRFVHVFRSPRAPRPRSAPSRPRPSSASPAAIHPRSAFTQRHRRRCDRLGQHFAAGLVDPRASCAGIRSVAQAGSVRSQSPTAPVPAARHSAPPCRRQLSADFIHLAQLPISRAPRRPCSGPAR